MAFSCSSQQSCRFLTVHNNSVFILHLKVTSDTGFNFPSCLKGERKKKKKTTAKCVPDLVSDRQVWPPVLFRGEKTIGSDTKGNVWYVKNVQWTAASWGSAQSPYRD